MIVPTPAQLAQIDAADKARADAVGDRVRLENRLSGLPELFTCVKVEHIEENTEYDELPVSVKVEYVSSVPSAADSVSRVPSPPYKAPIIGRIILCITSITRPC